MQSIDWELKNPPIFSYVAQDANEDASFVSAMKCMEQSVYELSLTYLKRSVHGLHEVGDLLIFVRELSNRCFDLYQASSHLDSVTNTPRLSKEAGALKSFVFTTEEILQLKASVHVYLTAALQIREFVNQNSTTQYDELIELMIYSRFNELFKKGFDDKKLGELTKLFNEYKQNLDENALFLIQKAHVMLGRQVQRLSYQQIYQQLSQLINSDSESETNDDIKSILLREIDARIIGSSLSNEKSIGFIRDAEVYFKLFTAEDQSLSVEVEFRLRMHFVYKTMHFISRIIENDRLMANMNDWLISHKKPWHIDINFAHRLLKTQNGGYHPFYGYGAHKPYMSIIKQTGCAAALPSYINSRDTLANKVYFLSKLSKVEKDELSRRGGRAPFFITGSHLYEPQPGSTQKSFSMIPDQQAKQYLDSVKASGMPVCSAGPSGASFSLAKTAAFVGLCLESNENAVFEIEMLTLACLAFMLPGDHTVHEIMLQFSSLFRTPYQAGPGFEQYIFPRDGSYVADTLNSLQAQKNTYVPQRQNRQLQAFHALVSRLPVLAPGFHYYNPQQINDLVDYQDTHLQWLMTDTLGAQKIALTREKNRLKNKIIQLSSPDVYQEEGQLGLFKHIHLYAELEKKRILIEQHRQELKSYFIQTADTTIASLADDAIEHEYVLFKTTRKAVDETNQRLQSQMSQSKYNFSPITVYLETQTLEDLQNPRYLLRARDNVMGYTANMMLNNAYNMANIRDFHANPPYTGAIQFSLNVQEFVAFEEYVRDVNKRFELFQFFFKQVFGTQTNTSYAYQGHKLLKDEVNVNRWRSQKNLNSFMSQGLINFFDKAPADIKVMIFDTVTIDLTTHPDRNNLRRIFTDLFKEHELINSQGKPKTFCEFTCLLTADQICKLIPDGLSYASLQSKAHLMGVSSWSSDAFLAQCFARKPVEIYYQMLLSELQNLPSVSNIIKQRQYFSLPENATIKTVNEYYTTLLKDAFDASYCIGLPSMSEKKVLTDEQIAALLGQTSQPGEALAVCPDSEVGIIALGDLLKTSGALEKATPSFEAYRIELLSNINYPYQSLNEVVDKVTEVLVTRCQKAQQMQENPYYGQAPLRTCLKSWTRFVAYIHYRDELELTDKALEIGLKSLCQLFITDDWTKCTNGLSGRLQDSLVDLVTASVGGDDSFLQADLDFRKHCATKAFGMTVATGSESSMKNNYKTDAFHQVGLIKEAPIQAMPAHNSLNFWNKFNEFYNPVTIYQNYVEAMVQSFLNYATANDDMGMYVFLSSLGLATSSLDELKRSGKRIRQEELTEADCTVLNDKFRFLENDEPGLWDLGQFKTVLPGQLVQSMLLSNILRLSPQNTARISQNNMFTAPSAQDDSTLGRAFSHSIG